MKSILPEDSVATSTKPGEFPERRRSLSGQPISSDLESVRAVSGEFDRFGNGAGSIKQRRLSIPGSFKQKLVVAISCFVVVAAVLFWNFSHLQKKPDEVKSGIRPVMTVSTQAPSVQMMESQLLVNGTVSAWDPITVGATTNGLEIKSILVEESDKVKKGQVLARLDASQIEPQLRGEQAKLVSDEANIRKAVQPNRPEDINTLIAIVSQGQASTDDASAAVTQSQANLTDALQSVGRYRVLSTEGAVSKQDLDTKETNVKIWRAATRGYQEKLKAAQCSLAQSREKLKMAQEGGRTEDVSIARATADQTRSNIAKLQADLDKTIIRAPVDGLITQRDAHVGDISTAGKSMFSIVRDNRLELKAMVPESDLLSVHPGETVSIQSALLGKPIAGSVREISPLINSDTRLATVRIDVPKDCGLKAGTYVDGHIKVGKRQTLTVPSQAVLSKDDANLVFVLRSDGKVQARIIQIGSQVDGVAEVSKGLSTKDNVVIDGAGFLKDGDYVTVAAGR